MYRIRNTDAQQTWDNRCSAMVIFKVWTTRTMETYSLTRKTGFYISCFIYSYCSSFNIVLVFLYMLHFFSVSTLYFVMWIHYIYIILLKYFYFCIFVLFAYSSEKLNQKKKGQLIKSFCRVLSPLINDCFLRKGSLQNFQVF